MEQKQKENKKNSGRPQRKHNTQTDHNIPRKWNQNMRTLLAHNLQCGYAFFKTPKPKVSEKHFKVINQWRSKHQKGLIDYYRQGKLVEGSDFQKVEVSKDGELGRLFDQGKELNIQDRDLRDIIDLALTIKHQFYRKELIPLYSYLCKSIRAQEASALIKEDGRRKWQNQIVNYIIAQIKNKKQFYCELTKLSKISQIDFKNFIKVQAYCFLSQYFNFRINEYFADSFEFVEDEMDRDTGQQIME